MKRKRLFSTLAFAILLPITTMATIVDGVRQKPDYQTSSFAANQEVYMLNVGSGQFFTQGNTWGTQASVGAEGLKVKFAPNGDYDYTMLCYCYKWNEGDAWRNVFFDSETELYVDRKSQPNYFFAVEENQNGTFRISTSNKNPTFGDYAGGGLYMGLKKNSGNTALFPFVDADEAYVDWVFITIEEFENIEVANAIYLKAQELKGWIDKIEAQNGNAGSLKDVYLNEASTMEELQAAISAAQPIYAQALINNAEDKENVDVTLLLTNPEYEDGTYGWTIQRANGGNVAVAGLPTNKCFEAFNNSNFDIYQTINSAPVGVYEIEVQGFYRYLRDAAAWNAYKAQQVDYVKPQGVPVYVYLNNNATPFKNIYSEPITKGTLYTTDASLLYPAALNPCEDDMGNWYPNEMYNSAVAFNAGMYKQSAFGLIAKEGDAFRIGVKGNSSQGGDSWVIWDNFKLTYRGFKAEVVKPVLETAIADLQQYATMLMGKTEFATLSNAFADAQTAISNNDGEAMFQALNALYNVKESVIASKDVFLGQEVPADTVRLAEAIADTEGKKLSQATLQAAQNLLIAIKGNTKYEGTEIDQLKADVTAAIQAINNSIAIYASLNEAIAAVKENVVKKAYKTIVDEANILVSTAETGYEAGSFTDTEAQAKTQALWSKNNELTASITAYASLAEAIGRLQNAITEASAETQHVAQSTLTKANLRLTASQTAYNEASVATADIAARVTAIDELITELTYSIELYKQYATALESLKTELDKGNKVSAALLTEAQQLYATASQAYNEGTTDDENVEATITQIETAVTRLSTSAVLYQQLGSVIPSLEEAVEMKAMQSLIDEATALLNSTKSGYDAATIANEDLEDLLDDIDSKVSAIENSAVLYANLKGAIDRLADAIDEVGDQATKSTLKKAQLRLTASQNLYNNGTIADADIPARVTAIDELIDDLTASIQLRQQYDAAIQDLDLAIANATGRVSATILQNATTLQTSIKTDYADGNVSDANLPAEVARIANITAALEAAANASDLAASLLSTIDNADDAIEDASLAIDGAEADAEQAYLSTAYRQQAESDIADGRNTCQQLSTSNANQRSTVQGKLAELDAKDLTAGNAAIVTISNALQALTNTVASDASQAAANTVNKVNEAINNSAYIIEMQEQCATFSSIVNLNFSGTGLLAYVAEEYNEDGGYLKLKEVTTVPAGTGVMVVAEEAGTYTIPAATNVEYPASNLFVANIQKSTIAPTEGGITNFILANGTHGINFYTLSQEGTLAAGKAYLQLSTALFNNASRAVNFVFGDGTATGLNNHEAVGQQDVIVYDLQGRRVAHPKNGLYIVNGKKVFIK